MRVSRRGVALLAALGCVCVVVLLAIVFAWPTGTKVDEDRWVNAGNLSDIPVNQPIRFPEHRFWLVRLESGEVLALWQRDPHLGCTVPWNPGFEFMGSKGWFRNPCHNQTYDLTGRCFFGPCIRGLDRFPVRIEDGEVRVNIRQVILGPPLDPNAQPVTPELGP